MSADTSHPVRTSAALKFATKSRFLISAWALLLFASGCMQGQAAAPAVNTNNQSISSGQSVPMQMVPDFRALIKMNQASVVNIFTSRTMHAHMRNPHSRGLQQQDPQDQGQGDDPFGGLPEDSPFREFFKRFGGGGNVAPRDQESRSLGSGFIISSNGKILTNAHVVDGADTIKVKLNDRTEKTAKVIGIDRASDVALLKIDAHDLPVVKFGDSDKLSVGDWVLAIGSPFALEYTATHGIVSALGRSIGGSSYVPFIQTDVPVNPGNSGGPLINMQGEVVGINSQIYSRTGGYMGLSFAIPINIVRNVELQLDQHGRVTRGWLGVQIQSVDSDLARSFGLDKPTGALVGDVDTKGPAFKAGIRSGDIILDYNGQVIHDEQDLPTLVATTAIGRPVPLKILRDGKNMTVNVTIAELKIDKTNADDQSQEDDNKQILNISVAPIPDNMREQLNVKSGGVVVAEVRPGPAEHAGIEQGDVILKMDGKEVSGPAQFIKQVASLPRDKPIAVLVKKQQGGTIYLAITLPKK